MSRSDSSSEEIPHCWEHVRVTSWFLGSPIADSRTHQISLSPLIVGDVAAMAVKFLVMLLHLRLLAAEVSKRTARLPGLCPARGDQNYLLIFALDVAEQYRW